MPHTLPELQHPLQTLKALNPTAEGSKKANTALLLRKPLPTFKPPKISLYTSCKTPPKTLQNKLEKPDKSDLT